MSIQIETYNKERLHSFIQSNEYRELEILPISYEKALSLINNPRLEEDDIILFEAREDEELIAYQIAMSDFFFRGEEKVKFAWLGAYWVARGKVFQDVVNELNKVIHEAYGGRLIFTPKSLCRKLNTVDPIELIVWYEQAGIRFHIRSDLHSVMSDRHPMWKSFRPMFTVVDEAFNTLVLPFLRHVQQISREVHWIRKADLEKENIALLLHKSFSKRGHEEMDWILRFPWMITSVSRSMSDKGKYHMAWKSDRFERYFLEGKMANSNCIMMICLENNKMRIPYAFYDDTSIRQVAIKVLDEAAEKEISHIDVFDENLALEMKKLKRKYVSSRRLRQSYACSGEMMTFLKDVDLSEVTEGEGIGVFV